jgi:hypothetical protein
MHVKMEVLCCKFSIFNNYNFVFFPFTPTDLALNALVSAKISIFSSPYQRQCELLPSLGVRHPSSVNF